MATQTVLQITGMDGGHCAQRLGQSLEQLDGVIKARVDEDRLPEDDLGQRVRAAGFDVAG